MPGREESHDEGGKYLPTHGAYDGKTLALVKVEKLNEIMNIIRGEVTAIAPTDKIVLELLARNLAKIELFDRWLYAHGLFKEDGTPLDAKEIQPVLKVYWQAVNSAVRICKEIGFTPEARMRLGIQMAQASDTLSRIQEAKKAGIDTI